jgi:hypothetical protein
VTPVRPRKRMRGGLAFAERAVIVAVMGSLTAAEGYHWGASTSATLVVADLLWVKTVKTIRFIT